MVNYFLLGLITLFGPFSELCLVWALSWFIYATYGKMTPFQLCIAIGLQCALITFAFSAMWYLEWWNIWISITGALSMSILCSSFTVISWSRQADSTADTRKALMKLETDLIPTHLMRVAKVYIDNGVHLIHDFINVLMSVGIGSIVALVIAGVVIVLLIVALVFYFGSVGLFDMHNFFQNAWVLRFFDSLGITVPLVNVDFDVGLVLLDRIWTWGIGVIFEAGHTFYMTFRIAYTIFVPMWNITAIFWRDLFANFALSIWDCTSEAYRGEASLDGSVGGFFQR